VIVTVVRYALGIVLALAVLGKARDFTAFRRGLDGFGLRGEFGRVGAFTVITVEALAVAVLFSPAPTVVAGLVGSALGAVFTALQTYLLAAGKQVSCRCFGEASAEPVSIRSWAKAAAILLAGLLLFAG
jgi:hypothetical protein